MAIFNWDWGQSLASEKGRKSPDILQKSLIIYGLYPVKVMCHVQEWLLSLTSCLSYLPLNTNTALKFEKVACCMVLTI